MGETVAVMAVVGGYTLFNWGICLLGAWVDEKVKDILRKRRTHRYLLWLERQPRQLAGPYRSEP